MKINGNLTFLSLGNGQLENAIIERLPAAPAGVAGRIYYDTGVNAYFYYNGTTWVQFAEGGSTVSSFNTGTTGLLANGFGSTPETGAVTLTGVLNPVNGGTGVANSNADTITLGGTLTTTGGNITFASAGPSSVTLPASGTLATVAGTVTSFQTSLSGLTPSSATSGVVTLAGTLGTGSGGTGASVTPGNGQLLIGNGTSFTVATLGSGTGISTTPGSGTLQINNTGVTSIIAGTGISVTAATGAVTISNTATPTLTATYVGYGNGSNVLTGTPDFTWTESLTVPVLTLGTASQTSAATITIKANTSSIVGNGQALAIVGSANASGNGGPVNITGGTAADTSTGGAVNITGGTGNAAHAIGGPVNITGGTGILNTGGNLNLFGGTGGPSNGSLNGDDGGNTTVEGGTGGIGAAGHFSGAGGNLTLAGGAAGAAGGGTANSGGTIIFQVAATASLANVLTITNTGGFSFGTSATNYGTIGQVLTSAGNAPPTWGSLSSSAVTSITFFGTGLTPATATSGAVTVGGVLNPASGGTGVNNGSNTITLGGSFTTTPSNAITLTTTGTTNVTLPTSGTLVTTTTAVTTFSGGTTGLTPSSATSGPITLAGTLVVGNGGTGTTSFTSNGVLYGNGTGAIQATAAGTTGQVLGNVSGVPTWQTTSAGFVTSITGTANQITASASTGAVTLSIPTTFTTPGSATITTTLTIDGLTYESAQSGIVAAGTSQGTATVLTKSYNVVSSTGSGTGVELPASGAGLEITVVNFGANTLKVYPAGSDQIDGAGASAAVLIPAGGTATYQSVNTGQWYTIDPVLVTSGVGISVTYANGQTVIANTGVSSFNTTLSGLTPSSSSTGTITLAGTLGVASGGTGDTTLTLNGMLYGNGTSPVGVTAAGSQYNVFQVGAGGVPTVGSIDISQAGTIGSSILAMTNGGTGADLTGIAGAPVYASGSTTLAIGTAGTTGNAYISGGSGAPTWQTVSSNLTSNPGAILEGNGSGAFTANGATFAGSGSFSGVTLNGTVTNATDATTKAYVDAAVANLNVHASALVFADSTNTQILAATYTNGTTDLNGGLGIGATLSAAAGGPLVVDGVTVPLNGRVVVNSFANTGYPPASSATTAIPNGIYTLTTAGTSWVLTRATDSNDHIIDQVEPGDFVFISEGTVYANTGWTETNVGTASLGTVGSIKLGTDGIYFTQFSGAGTYHAGSGLTLTGSTFAVNPDNVTIYINGIGGGQVAVDSSAVAGQSLLSNGTVGTTATWGAVNLASTNAVTGTLPFGNGGTGSTSYTTNGVIYAGASGLDSTAVGLTGQVLVGNTGSAPTWGTLSGVSVTSVTGTANEIAVNGVFTAQTGAVTLTIPSVFIAPGSAQVTTYLYESSSPSVAAAGTNQGTATALTSQYNVVTSVSSGQGVILPIPAVAGLEITVVNLGSSQLLIYPPSGGNIDASGTNVPISIPNGGTWTGEAATTTLWYTVVPSFVAGTGVNVSYGMGTTTVSNTGVLSFSGGSTGLTPSTSTGVITLGGTLIVANGGTGATSFTAHGVLIGEGTSAVTSTSAGTAGQVLTSNGASADPTFQSVSSLSLVTSFQTSLSGLTPTSATTGAVTLAGTLGLSSGGTSANLTAVNGGLVYSTASAMAISAAGTAGQFVLSGGAGAPTYLTNSTPIDTDGSGTVDMVVGSSFNVFGTANEITTTAVTSPAGVTISIPSTFVAPGSITATTSMTVSGLTANSFLYSGTAGLLTTTAAPTNGQLLIGSTGVAPVAATLTAGTGITITNTAGSITIAQTSGSAVTSFQTSLSGLTPSTATTGAVTLAGTLGVASGGTGDTTFTTNGVLFGNGTSALGVTAAGTTGQALLANSGSAPTWGAVSLTTAVTNTLPVGNGGTGLTAVGAAGNVIASTGSAFISTPIEFIYDTSAHSGPKMAYLVPHNLGQKYVSVVCYDQTVDAVYTISAVTTGLGGQFEISGGNYTSTFTAGFQFAVIGSTNNDATWTVASSSYSSPNTIITVVATENVGSTANGSIYVGPNMVLPQQVMFVDANNLIVTFNQPFNSYIVITGVAGVSPV